MADKDIGDEDRDKAMFTIEETLTATVTYKKDREIQGEKVETERGKNINKRTKQLIDMFR